ncbi:MAG: apolipoprotein N-acyltransferase [Candidatus Scalindua sp.]|nr:apolipoprotein N-acyltransferase [Candidatus Scalindua sp.]
MTTLVKRANRLNKNAFSINILFAFPAILFLSFSFPSPGISYLIWIAFVPWLLILSTGYRTWFFSYVIGISFFIINLSWLRHVTYLGWILLSLYLAAYFLAFGVISYYLKRKLRLPYIVIAPFVWVTFEFIRSSPLSGFPWFFIGHTQYLHLTVIQIADITGVYGVSFLIMIVNAAIADMTEQVLLRRTSLFMQYPHLVKKGKTFFCAAAIIPGLILLLVLVYGFLHLNRHIPYQDGPNVCLVQGNIAQSIKIDPDDKQQEEIVLRYRNLTLDVTEKAIDLVVWPETMVPGILNIDPQILDRKIDSLSKESVQKSAQTKNTHMLVGGTAIDVYENRPFYYNTAFHYDRDGKYQDRYDKIHLVPFGEFVPFEKFFPFLSYLVPYEVNLSSGKRRTIFKLDTIKDQKLFQFGVIICYEDTIAPLVRKFRLDGVDFMVNITNDAWFCNSAELDQHLSIMVFRSVENRVSIARAANTGISSFISPSGEIYDFLSKEGKIKEVDGTLCNNIKFEHRKNTWYTDYGDVFAISCLVTTILLSFIAARKKNFT